LDKVYRVRREKLRALLCEHSLSAAVLDDRIDQLYFSGTMQSNYLIIPAHGSSFQLNRKAIDLTRQESSDMEVYLFRSTAQILEALKSNGIVGPVRLGVNQDVMTVNNFRRWEKMLPEAKWEDIGFIIRGLRRIKDDIELAFLRHGGEALQTLPDLAEAALRNDGATELSVAAAIESHLRLQEHGSIIRLGRMDTETVIGVVSGGRNTLKGSRFEGVCAGSGLDPANPFGPGNCEIMPGDPVVVDYVMNYRGYHVDQTRMVSKGRFVVQAAQRAYEDMFGILHQLEEQLKPGGVPSSLFAFAQEEAARLGWSDGFMGYGTEKVGFIGHGVGLTLDEEPYFAPKYNVPLQTGMVVALEPKVMLPEIGVVGIEDTYIITDTGARRITIADRSWRVVG
jgi:Xaa-Pro dipeptidase